MRSCFAVLADADHPAHGTIRDIVQSHLDQDLATEEALLHARRGQVPGG